MIHEIVSVEIFTEITLLAWLITFKAPATVRAHLFGGEVRAPREPHEYNLKSRLDMNRRGVQIVISREPQGAPGGARPLGFWRRLKGAFIALGLASIGLGILVFLLILGSMIAAVLWAVFVLAVAYAILRASFRRAKQ